jgi:membrane fusion protein, multidrug efflux system
MDQRIDSKQRDEFGGGWNSADDLIRQDHSWVETLRERRTAVLALAALIIVALIGLVVWWVNSMGYLSTDDAFIDARTVTISSQVNAAVVDVPVTDNQSVGAGTVLVRLDDRDYKARVDQAKAQVDQAQADVAYFGAQINAQQARIRQAEKQVAQSHAVFVFAQQEDKRYQRLVKTGSVTVEQAQQYTSDFLQAKANLAAVQANLVATQKQLPVLQTQRKQAEAQVESERAALEQAETNLSRTVVTAPVAGRVANLTAAKGEYATAGQALMMFIPRRVWVTANFKETELSDIRPGEPVNIEIDAYPNHTFKGHVASIQAGSGTAFSLLPPEDATGNYVKIVQRVPVKITFNKPPKVLLGPGLSVLPSVKTG